MAENLSVCMLCLVFVPSFRIAKSLFVMKLMISKELSSFLLQWNSHCLLCELKSPNIIMFSLKFEVIFCSSFSVIGVWGAYMFVLYQWFSFVRKCASPLFPDLI